MFNKAWAGTIVSLITAVSVAAEDSVISSTDLGTLAGAVAAAFGLTWLIPKSFVLIGKALAGGAGAAFTAWVAAGTDGSVTGNDWIAVAVAAVAAFGAVYQTTNEEPTVELPPPTLVSER